MFTFEKRFTYLLRTAMGQFGTIEAHYLYMLACCLRAYFGPSFATGDVKFLSSKIGFLFNLQNVAAIMGAIVMLNGTIIAFTTALKAAKKDGVVKNCIMYFLSIKQGYVLLLFILPYTYCFKYAPITSIITVCCPMVKICWKLIISSVLKFHFNPFTWDHVLPTVGWLLVLVTEQFSVLVAVLIMYATFMISFTHLLAFAYGTVNQIANCLDINVFTIKPKPYDNLEKNDTSVNGN